jgi:hypothetical protein
MHREGRKIVIVFDRHQPISADLARELAGDASQIESIARDMGLRNGPGASTLASCGAAAGLLIAAAPAIFRRIAHTPSTHA